MFSQGSQQSFSQGQPNVGQQSSGQQIDPTLGRSAGQAQYEQEQQKQAVSYEEFESLQRALHEQQSKNRELDATLGKLKGVFSPEDDKPAPDAWYDDVLSAALEADKAGRPMPITTKLATQLRQSQLQQEELRSQVQQLLDVVKQQRDPNVVHNQRVYENLDSIVSSSVEQLYGDDEDVKSFVATKVIKQIKALQAEDPDSWEQIRKDPEKQRRLVLANLKSSIPKGLQRRIEQEYLQNSKMSTQEIAQAIVEAKKIQDPSVRERVIAKARQEYLSNLMEQNKGSSLRDHIQNEFRR